MKYIMRDKVGNIIHAGDDVYFDPVQGVVEIVSIDDPGRKKDGSDKPGCINMLVRMPFIPQKAEQDKEKDEHTVAFGFLLKCFDPAKAEEEAEKGNRAIEAVKNILDKGKKVAQMKM